MQITTDTLITALLAALVDKDVLSAGDIDLIHETAQRQQEKKLRRSIQKYGLDPDAEERLVEMMK